MAELVNIKEILLKQYSFLDELMPNIIPDEPEEEPVDIRELIIELFDAEIIED